MSKLVISGGKQLSGRVEVLGSKNAVLPLMASALITQQPVELHNVPNIEDVNNLIKIFQTIGVNVQRHQRQLKITAAKIDSQKLPQEMIGKMRGSILLMGALLGRERRAKLPEPGGDIIGARPIETHLDAFEQLGAKIKSRRGLIEIDGTKMKAGEVTLNEFSVTATENIMLAAATLPGLTTIKIAASEPHIKALADALCQMGVKINGSGTAEIQVQGTKKLSGAKIKVIPDMLEAGWFILAGALLGNNLEIDQVPVNDLTLFLKKLQEIGVKMSIKGKKIKISRSPIKAFKIQTLPYPGIPTDLQAPFAVLATQAKGASLIHDPMYERRFKHCDELLKMGANITVCDPHRIIVHGPTPLFGRSISSPDIRAGATLVLAGLVARGDTEIDQVEILDRGYEKIEERLKMLGAEVKRQGA